MLTDWYRGFRVIIGDMREGDPGGHLDVQLLPLLVPSYTASARALDQFRSFYIVDATFKLPAGHFLGLLLGKKTGKCWNGWTMSHRPSCSVGRGSGSGPPLHCSIPSTRLSLPRQMAKFGYECGKMQESSHNGMRS